MKRFRDVTFAVMRRSLKAWYGNPAFLLPSIAFPLFFLLAFAGGLSGLSSVPGFDFPAGYTAFQFVFVMVHASAFGGVFTGFAIAADFESGFARRLLLAAPNRIAILAGYATAAVIRAVVTVIFLFAVALATGMNINAGALDLVGMLALVILASLAAMLFGAGVAFRARTIQAAPAMQIPVFIMLFLAPVYVPRDLLNGWLKTAAGFNPFTAIFEGGRDLISGITPDLVLTYGIAGALAAVAILWAVRGLRKAEAAG